MKELCVAIETVKIPHFYVTDKSLWTTGKHIGNGIICCGFVHDIFFQISKCYQLWPSSLLSGNEHCTMIFKSICMYKKHLSVVFWISFNYEVRSMWRKKHNSVCKYGRFYIAAVLQRWQLFDLNERMCLSQTVLFY